jgi:hypothetical protein
VRSELARHWWTLERFGFTPQKLRTRLRHPQAPPVLCVTMPKSGTHLLERALCLHPMLRRKLLPTISGENVERYGGVAHLLGRLRPGEVVVSHLRYEQRVRDLAVQGGIGGLFLVRDPRDMVVSEAFYLAHESNHRHHTLFASLPSDRDRIRLAITGDPGHGVVSIRERLRYFAGWFDSGFLVVRFESLVGSAGGGSDGAQVQELRAIFRHLGVDARPEEIERIGASLFSDRSPTFRRGAIGGWQDYFDADLLHIFDEVAGDEVALVGYER